MCVEVGGERRRGEVEVEGKGRMSNLAACVICNCVAREKEELCGRCSREVWNL